MATNSAYGFVPALMGLTTVEMVKLWQSHAPTLAELRAAPPEDVVMQQRIQDANYLGVAMAVLVGGTMSFFMRSMLPLSLSVLSVWLYSKWYEQVLIAPRVM